MIENFWIKSGQNFKIVGTYSEKSLNSPVLGCKRSWVQIPPPRPIIFNKINFLSGFRTVTTPTFSYRYLPCFTGFSLEFLDKIWTNFELPSVADQFHFPFNLNFTQAPRGAALCRESTSKTQSIETVVSWNYS